MQTVKVRLRKPRRVLSFICDNLTINRDEECVVQSDRGPELGVCLLPPEPCSEEIAKRISMRVLRKLNARDRETRAYLAGEEAKARVICFEQIRKRDMPMKLVDVEYTFDKKKIVFYFTAEDRVDFRELVRDLAHELRSRIELRHIQVRDEAKMVGGLGSCGRELCCSSWLNEFKPISMRMAKRQNLSLNPSKISGQCGRLLCCLGYENDQYESFKRKKKQEEQRDTPEPAAAIVEHAKEEPRPEPPKAPRMPVPAPSEEGSWVSSQAKPTDPAGSETDGEKKPRRGRRRRPRRRGGANKDGGGDSGQS